MELIDSFNHNPVFDSLILGSVDEIDPDAIACDLEPGQSGKFNIETESGPVPFGIRRFANLACQEVIQIYAMRDERYMFEAAVLHNDPDKMKAIASLGNLSSQELEYHLRLNEEALGLPTATFSLRSKLETDSASHPGMNAGLFIDFGWMLFESLGFKGSNSIELVLSNITKGRSVFYQQYLQNLRATGGNHNRASRSLWPMRKYKEVGYRYLFDVREVAAIDPLSGEFAPQILLRHSRSQLHPAPILRGESLKLHLLNGV